MDQIERSDGVIKREASAELKTSIDENVVVQLGVTNSETQSERYLVDGTGSRTDVGARVTLEGVWRRQDLCLWPDDG